MQDEWILEVCHDMYQYAQDNGLPKIAASMKLAVEMASLEILGSDTQFNPKGSIGDNSSAWEKNATPVLTVVWHNDLI